MSYLRKRSPSDALINAGKLWSDLELENLRYCLAAGEPLEEIAVFLCRNVYEVRAKAAEIVARGKS